MRNKIARASTALTYPRHRRRLWLYSFGRRTDSTRPPLEWPARAWVPRPTHERSSFCVCVFLVLHRIQQGQTVRQGFPTPRGGHGHQVSSSWSVWLLFPQSPNPTLDQSGTTTTMALSKPSPEQATHIRTKRFSFFLFFSKASVITSVVQIILRPRRWDRGTVLLRGGTCCHKDPFFHLDSLDGPIHHIVQ